VRSFSAALLAMASFTLNAACASQVVDIAWSELPPLPPSAGQRVQPGVAGPFVGVHRGALLVAGGANFPEKMPWDGGAKIWWDDIWVLEPRTDGSLAWVGDKTFTLPRRLGYGISVSSPEGVICAGGHDVDRCYADVFLLSWEPRTREVRRTALPPMPESLSFMAGALVGDTVYIAGGQHVMKGAVPTSVFWALDLSKRDRPGEFKWQVLPAWPGPPRVLPVAAAQRTAAGDAFFLFSGRAPQPGRGTEILSDAYVYEPARRAWRKLPNISGRRGVSVMAGMAVAAGDNEVLLFGGDRGELFAALESHDLKIEALRKEAAAAPADGRAEIDRRIEAELAAKRKIYSSHPGFGREVFALNTRTDTWRVVTRSTIDPQVTTIAVPWENGWVLPSGEIRPGVRTPRVIRATPKIQ
jgi:solute:Na+ symporter, SSS family